MTFPSFPHPTANFRHIYYIYETHTRVPFTYHHLQVQGVLTDVKPLYRRYAKLVQYTHAVSDGSQRVIIYITPPKTTPKPKYTSSTHLRASAHVYFLLYLISPCSPPFFLLSFFLSSCDVAPWPPPPRAINEIMFMPPS